jgi:hypothetical protein
MIEGDDLRLDRQGDALILRARHIARWVGAPLVGFALYLIWRIYGIGIPNQSWLALLAYWFGLVLGVMFLGIGVFLLLPREVITTFDLRSHRVVHHLSIGRGWYERRRTYAFAEIAGLRLTLNLIHERETLVGEHTTIINRIKATLARLGIRLSLKFERSCWAALSRRDPSRRWVLVRRAS